VIEHAPPALKATRSSGVSLKGEVVIGRRSGVTSKKQCIPKRRSGLISKSGIKEGIVEHPMTAVGGWNPRWGNLFHIDVE
jgi:hypothetical protein